MIFRGFLLGVLGHCIVGVFWKILEVVPIQYTILVNTSRFKTLECSKSSLWQGFIFDRR